ncbi:UNVERIFIED_CONTAM: Auxin response factor 22 [Sesamum radiatum]|uniref:Auxin response factor 22 n=1 Tax=Sesamum radiatum TaxID=300843 RepID=A0AAW2UL29_SESRA
MFMGDLEVQAYLQGNAKEALVDYWMEYVCESEEARSWRLNCVLEGRKWGSLCRRRGSGIGGNESTSGWNSGAAGNFAGFSSFLKEDENKLMHRSVTNGSLREKGKVKPESVLEATFLAANGQPFEVVYYPRASTPEFCVKASSVTAAMRIQWCPGMRFKMPFETEDSSRISWFMGTIASVQVADPLRWPNSPWRLLQVTWDEPDLLQNVKCVSPWLVEMVSNMPAYREPGMLKLESRCRISTLATNCRWDCYPPVSCGLILMLKFQRIRLGAIWMGKSCSGGTPWRTVNFAPDSEVPPKSLSTAQFLWKPGYHASDLGLDTGHCKVFMESEDVGRTLDLSVLGSYEELYKRLEHMFGIEKLETLSHVFYRDATGAVKQAGAEPFSEFMKNAKRLTILMKPSSNSSERKLITGLPTAERGLDSSNQAGPLSIFA